MSKEHRDVILGPSTGGENSSNLVVDSSLGMKAKMTLFHPDSLDSASRIEIDAFADAKCILQSVKMIPRLYVEKEERCKAEYITHLCILSPRHRSDSDHLQTPPSIRSSYPLSRAVDVELGRNIRSLASSQGENRPKKTKMKSETLLQFSIVWLSVMLFQIETTDSQMINQGEVILQLVKAVAQSVGRAYFGTTCTRYIVGEDKLATVSVIAVSLGTVWNAWTTLPSGIAAAVTAEVTLGLILMALVQVKSIQPAPYVLDTIKKYGWKGMKACAVMEAMKKSGVLAQSNTAYRGIAVDICDGCVLTVFVLVMQCVWMQAAMTKNNVHRRLKRVHRIFAAWGLLSLIIINVVMGVVLILSTLDWKTK